MTTALKPADFPGAPSLASLRDTGVFRRRFCGPRSTAAGLAPLRGEVDQSRQTRRTLCRCKTALALVLSSLVQSGRTPPRIGTMRPIVADGRPTPIGVAAFPSVKPGQSHFIADHPNSAAIQIHILAVVIANILDPIPNVGRWCDHHDRFRTRGHHAHRRHGYSASGYQRRDYNRQTHRRFHRSHDVFPYSFLSSSRFWEVVTLSVFSKFRRTVLAPASSMARKKAAGSRQQGENAY
jgi:hypothetical protein